MTSSPRTSPLTATELVDEYFIENRTKLLDIAAFLDRLDRADPGLRRRPTSGCAPSPRRSPRSTGPRPDRHGPADLQRPAHRAARGARPQGRRRRLRPRARSAPMKYIDHHAHMVSRTTDDYQQMALSGCVAVTEPAFWAGWDRSTRRRHGRLLPPAHRLRAAPRRAVPHPALRLGRHEPEGVGQPRALAAGARAAAAVPRRCRRCSASARSA